MFCVWVLKELASTLYRYDLIQFSCFESAKGATSEAGMSLPCCQCVMKVGVFRRADVVCLCLVCIQWQSSVMRSA